MGLSLGARARLLNSKGQGLAEYIVVAILIAIIVIVGVRYFGGSLTEQFESATEEIEHVRDGGPVSLGDDDSASRKPSPVLRDDADGGGGDELEVSGGGSGRGGGAGGSGDDDFASLRPNAVGELSSDEPLDQIELNWGTVGFIGLLACAIGVFFVVQSVNKERKKKKKTDSAKSKRKKRLFSRGSDEHGQAMVELVLSAITLLFTILGVIQLALVLNAYSLVRYAAYNAARAAIVHGGDSEKMQEAARISLLAIYPRHGRADHQRGMVDNYLAASATDNLPALTFASTKYYLQPITEVKLINTAAAGPADVVTFDDPVFRERAIITVQVVHLYELVIPLVNRISFFVYKQIKGPGVFDIAEDPEVIFAERGYGGQSLDYLAAETHRKRLAGRSLHDIEYRIPLVAHYTMRLQSDLEAP